LMKREPRGLSDEAVGRIPTRWGPGGPEFPAEFFPSAQKARNFSLVRSWVVKANQAPGLRTWRIRGGARRCCGRDHMRPVKAEEGERRLGVAERAGGGVGQRGS